MRFRVWGLRLRVWGLGFEVEGLGLLLPQDLRLGRAQEEEVGKAERGREGSQREGGRIMDHGSKTRSAVI